jgi:hypothetical protein
MSGVTRRVDPDGTIHIDVAAEESPQLALRALADVLKLMAFAEDNAPTLTAQERLYRGARVVYNNLPPDSFAASLMMRLCMQVKTEEPPAPKPDLRLVQS